MYITEYKSYRSKISSKTEYAKNSSIKKYDKLEKSQIIFYHNDFLKDHIYFRIYFFALSAINIDLLSLKQCIVSYKY